MPTVCILCNQPTGLRAIGAMIAVGDPAKPDAAIVCRSCAALPADEQKRRRAVAIERGMIRDEVTPRRDSRLA